MGCEVCKGGVFEKKLGHFYLMIDVALVLGATSSTYSTAYIQPGHHGSGRRGQMDPTPSCQSGTQVQRPQRAQRPSSGACLSGLSEWYGRTLTPRTHWYATQLYY